MPRFTVKDLEKMVNDRLDNRASKQFKPETNLIARLRLEMQKGQKPALPKLPKL